MLQLGIDKWQPIVQQPRNNFTVKTLEPSMSYKFRVIAYNEFGASRPSEPSEVVTTKGKGWFIPISGVRKPSLTARGRYLHLSLSTIYQYLKVGEREREGEGEGAAMKSWVETWGASLISTCQIGEREKFRRHVGS